MFPDATMTTDGFEVTSNTQTAEQMAATFAPEPEPAKEPAEPAAKPAAEPTKEPAAETVEPEPSPESEAGKVLAAKKNTLEARKKSIQAEIDDLTRQKHETRREAEAARREVESLRRELDSLRPKEPQPAAVEGKPTPDQFETYEEYVEKVADWRAEQKLAAERAERQREQQARAQAELKTALDARVEKFKADHPDYQDVVDSVYLPPDGPANGAIMAHLQFSDFGPHLAYELGQHPEELTRIAALPPGFAVAALGRLEAKIEARLAPAPSSGPETKTPSLTSAKPPIKPLGSSPVASDDGEVPDDLSLDDHIARMNRREHKPIPRRRP